MISADGHHYRVNGFCETTKTDTCTKMTGFFHSCHARGDHVHPRTGRRMSELYPIIKKEASIKIRLQVHF